MAIPQTRVWHPESTPASGVARRPGDTPQKAFPKVPEPDKALENKKVRVYLVTGEVITGTLRRTAMYLLVIQTSQGPELSVYKHSVCYLAEA